MSEASVIPIESVQPDLSEFGKYLYKLMLSKGIGSFNALATKMSTDEYIVYRQAVSKYAKGKQPVPPKFARRLAMVLLLTEEEERSLSWALYRWG